MVGKEVIQKRCSTCVKWLPATNMHFHRNCSKKDGLNNECRACKTIRGIARRKTQTYRKKDKDPLRRLRHNLAGQIRKSVANWEKGTKWTALVDWTFAELVSHIEKQFVPKMVWENYGKWHLDHIRPVYGFTIPTTNSDGFKECWALNNLQPLWAYENQIKGPSSFANHWFNEDPKWEEEN